MLETAWQVAAKGEIMDDPVSKALMELGGSLPSPRTNLSDVAKDELVAKVGPRTARDIVKASQDYPLRRIPFLFSTVDTQAVVDILANDMDAAIGRALAKSTARRRPR